MRIITLLSLILLAKQLFVQQLFAQQPVLYAIMVADVPADAGVGGGVQQDLQRVHGELKRMAVIAGYTFRFTEIIHDYRYKPKNVIEAIQKVPANTAVLVFYYSGHGQSGKDHLPCLQMGQNNNEWLCMQAAIAEIRKKNPRLALVITDCCNDNGSRSYSNAITIHTEATNTEQTNLRLLLGCSGEIVMTASKYGEEAFVGPEGSFFTLHLFRELTKVAKSSDTPDWEAIFRVAKERTSQAVLAAKRMDQTPYAQIFIQCR